MQEILCILQVIVFPELRLHWGYIFRTEANAPETRGMVSDPVELMGKVNAWSSGFPAPAPLRPAPRMPGQDTEADRPYNQHQP